MDTLVDQVWDEADAVDLATSAWHDGDLQDTLRRLEALPLVCLTAAAASLHPKPQDAR